MSECALCGKITRTVYYGWIRVNGIDRYCFGRLCDNCYDEFVRECLEDDLKQGKINPKDKWW